MEFLIAVESVKQFFDHVKKTLQNVVRQTQIDWESLRRHSKKQVQGNENEKTKKLEELGSMYPTDVDCEPSHFSSLAMVNTAAQTNNIHHICRINTYQHSTPLNDHFKVRRGHSILTEISASTSRRAS
jgi:hypothetical protein